MTDAIDFDSGRSFNIWEAMAEIPDPAKPLILADLLVSGFAMLGVIRVARAGTDGFWERHDGGDEVLILLDGACTMTLRPDGEAPTDHELGPGDVLWIPRGVPHSGKLHSDELKILFVTPRQGNVSWSDDPTKPGRH